VRSFTSLITLLLIVSCKTAEATADVDGLFNLNLGDSIDYQKVTTKIDEEHIQYAHVVIIDKLEQYEFLVSSEDEYREKGSQSPSEFSRHHKLKLAINANYYGLDTGEPIGRVISKGKKWASGTLRNSRYAGYFSCSNQNSCRIGWEDEFYQTAKNYNVISGYPVLVKNGRALNYKNRDRHPRTAIGINKAENKIVIVVTDGRAVDVLGGFKQVLGYTYDELSTLFLKLGVTDALNLDGGGSSQMILGGRRVNMRRATHPKNHPDQVFNERKVPVLFGIK